MSYLQERVAVDPEKTARADAVLTMAKLLGTKFDKARLDAYLEALSDLPTGVILATSKAAARSVERFPSPAAFRKLATETRRDVRPSEPPAATRRHAEGLTAEGWLEHHDLEPRVEWLTRRRHELEKLADLEASCGQREECREGRCTEQVPVPRATLMYGGEHQPPTLYIAWVPCPEHAARCEWRKGNRPAEKRA